jgi:hypothetical protein
MRVNSLASIFLATILAFGVVAAVPAFAHEEHTDFITNAEYIKGHLEQAVANKQVGNTELAIAHSGHPIEEVYTLMEGPLEEASPQRAADLREALEELPNSVESETVQAFTQRVNDIIGMLDEAVEVVAGEEAVELVTKAGVITGLLETAGVEYNEAVENGQVIEMIEYQDASAFISRANAVFATIQSEIDEHEAEEIVEFFEQLDLLTASNASFEEVETVIGGIIHEFEEVFGLEEEESVYDGQAYIDRIIELLDEAVVAYEAGDAQEARALAIEAYLDNYEFIEGDIEEDDPELMVKIEVAIREELVDMIDEGRPVAEIESHVAAIKADLETARAFVKSPETFLETKGDSWNTINTLLGEVEKLTGKNATATHAALEKLEQARAKYNQVFAEEAEEHDPETAQTIESAYYNIEAAVESDTVLEVTLNKQYADKLVYKIAFIKIEEELLEAEVEEAAEWFTVMSKKFKYDQTPSAASQAMAELEADHSKIDELSPVILDDLRATFLLKVKEEIAEALEAQGKQPPDNANAQKFAVEGIAYYRTIQPDVAKKLGAEQEATLFHELEEFFEYAQKGNLAKMNEEAEEINALLLAYEGKETTGIGAAISEIIDLLSLVNAEYIDAVRDGQIINQEEYDETVLFINRATEKFNAVKPDLLDIAAEETTEAEDDLASIATMVENKEDTQQVSDTVQHVQAELQAILEASGSGEVEIDGWGYIDRIKELLDQAVAAYKEGSYEEARNLAREAYLDNYEYIEADIAEEDRELMEKIEIDMRVELVQMIDNRRPASEVEAHVDQIKADLEVARNVVVPEFPLAFVVLATVAATILAGTLYTRRKGGLASF